MLDEGTEMRATAMLIIAPAQRALPQNFLHVTTLEFLRVTRVQVALLLREPLSNRL